MKIIARRIAVSAVLAGAVLGTLALPAQAADVVPASNVSAPGNGVDPEADVELETTGGTHKDEVFPTDIFGYEDPEDFIQAYYEYKKGCTNDCEAGFVRNLVHNLV